MEERVIWFHGLTTGKESCTGNRVFGRGELCRDLFGYECDSTRLLRHERGYIHTTRKGDIRQWSTKRSKYIKKASGMANVQQTASKYILIPSSAPYPVSELKRPRDSSVLRSTKSTAGHHVSREKSGLLHTLRTSSRMYSSVVSILMEMLFGAR